MLTERIWKGDEYGTHFGSIVAVNLRKYGAKQLSV